MGFFIKTNKCKTIITYPRTRTHSQTHTHKQKNTPAQLMAQLIDTLLLAAAARCRPPRREEAVALLSRGRNRCVRAGCVCCY